MNAVESAHYQDSQTAESELDAPIWSLISFERVEGKNLTYETASNLMDELERRRVPGLCIVTDQTAERIKTQG